MILPLVEGRAAAGRPYTGTVPTGHAVRVLTGAALPAGVDTVVLDEDTRADSARVAFRGPVKVGANTRKAGEDVAAGAVALEAGRRLGPADLALAAAVGLGDLPVRKRLRVAVLSTGDEIRRGRLRGGAGADLRREPADAGGPRRAMGIRGRRSRALPGRSRRAARSGWTVPQRRRTRC